MTTNTIAVSVAEAFIQAAKGDVTQEKLVIGVTTALKDAFVACKTAGEFLTLFGTGGNSKLPTYVQGEIDAAFRVALSNVTLPRGTSKMTKEELVIEIRKVQKKALAHFKSEMSNCRKVRALGLTLIDKGARAVLNDHRKETAKANPPAVITTAPETPVSTDWTLLGKTASMEDVSNFVSAYVAHHGDTACRALANQMKDYMPIAVTRTRKAV